MHTQIEEEKYTQNCMSLYTAQIWAWLQDSAFLFQIHFPFPSFPYYLFPFDEGKENGQNEQHLYAMEQIHVSVSERVSAVHMPNGVLHRSGVISRTNRSCQLVLEKVMPRHVSQPMHKDRLPIQDAIVHTSGCHLGLTLHSGHLKNESPFLYQFAVL